VGAETIDFSAVDDVPEALRTMTRGRGPDRCIDAVGMEAEGGIAGACDEVKQAAHFPTDRDVALRQAILSCRKGGTLAILGTYFHMDQFPLGAVIHETMTVRAGLQNGHRHIPRLLELTEKGLLDASYLITQRFSLEDGARAYEMFATKTSGCVRPVFSP